MAMHADTITRAPGTVTFRGSAIGPAFRRNRLLIGLIALHFLAVYALCLMLGRPFGSGTTSTLVNLMQVQVPIFILLLFIGRVVWMVAAVRPRHPPAWLSQDLGGLLLDRERMFTGIIAFTSMCLFAGSFAVAKDLIPLINPFSWDPTLAHIDRLLHFGHDPWTLIFPLTGTPWMTTGINFIYHLWLMLIYFLIFTASFNATGHAKHRTFLVAYILVWTIAGNILATVFASVGPVFYEPFGYGDTFAPLMDQLYAFQEVSPVWALPLQEMLLEDYMNDGPIKGISAMPSMHVASTIVMTVYAFSVSRILGGMMVAFAAVILLGSVHLGWHYAIDGYVSIPVALGCWALARYLVRRLASERYREA